MASTMCRVKVLVGKEMPFWMLVDVQECPRVHDIEKKISHIKCVPVKSLSVDECILPSDEKSVIFRENDQVHVNIHPLEETLLGTGGSLSVKAHVKKKRKDRARESDIEDVTSSSLHGTKREGVPDTGVENGNKFDLESSEFRQSTKHKHRKHSVEGDGFDHNSFFHKASSDKANGHKDMQNIKIHPKQSVPSDLCEQSSVIHEAEKGSGQKAVKIKTSGAESLENVSPKHKSDDAAGDTLNAQDTTLLLTDNISESASGMKRKRKRKRTKKKDKEPEALSNSGSQIKTTDWSAPAERPELNLPKWQQPKSKKRVFTTSDEEEESMVVEENDVIAVSQIRTETQPDAFTFSDDKSTKSTHDDEYFHSNINEATCDSKDSTENVRGGDKITENEWNRSQKTIKNRNCNLLQPPQPASFTVNNSAHVIPGHPNQATSSNLAEFLRSSPEERGVTLPPFMKSERLPNGAMMYTRVPPPTGGYDARGSRDQKSSPYHLTKQEQLATGATNKSIIIQNPVSGNGFQSQKTSTPVATKESRRTSEISTLNSIASPQVMALPLYRDYSQFPDLTTPPSVGDQIAYKVLELGEDYTPGESDYKEAEVLQFDSSSKTLLVKMLNIGSKQRKRQSGRFDMPDEDTADDGETVTVELATMLAAKLLTAPS